MRIWKFQFPAKPGTYEFDAPLPARILTAHEQGEYVCLWVACGNVGDPVTKKVILVETGCNVSMSLEYVGTTFHDNGDYVLHVFKEK